MADAFLYLLYLLFSLSFFIVFYRCCLWLLVLEGLAHGLEFLDIADERGDAKGHQQRDGRDGD